MRCEAQAVDMVSARSKFEEFTGLQSGEVLDEGSIVFEYSECHPDELVHDGSNGAHLGLAACDKGVEARMEGIVGTLGGLQGGHVESFAQQGAALLGSLSPDLMRLILCDTLCWYLLGMAPAR